MTYDTPVDTDFAIFRLYFIFNSTEMTSSAPVWQLRDGGCRWLFSEPFYRRDELLAALLCGIDQVHIYWAKVYLYLYA